MRTYSQKRIESGWMHTTADIKNEYTIQEGVVYSPKGYIHVTAVWDRKKGYSAQFRIILDGKSYEEWIGKEICSNRSMAIQAGKFLKRVLAKIEPKLALCGGSMVEGYEKPHKFIGMAPEIFPG